MTTTDNAIAQTATLQMVRAEISVRDFHRWMGSKRLQDPDHAMHCLLTECFGELAPRPFRLITPRGGSSGVLYGYGLAGADALREAAGICADPLQARIMPAGKLDSKAMPSQWEAGKRLGFEIRIRPVVRLLKDPSIRTVNPPNVRHFREGENRPGKECDAFQWEAVQYPKGEMPHSREDVYARWLSAQLDRRGGASLDPEETKLASFQRTRAVRKLHKRHSEGPDAIMRGVLTITDADAFANLLAQGIGRHRAYGYGMLLLRPARV
jgi:CRISPR system Cascade subunit CasE